MEKNQKNKFYTLKSLVHEITGIDEDNTKLFDSAFKSIQRIETKLRSISSYSDTHGIPADKKDSFVNLMKDIYSNQEAKSVLNKFADGKIIDEREGLLLYDIFMKNIEDENLKEVISIYRDEMKVEELKKIVDEILNSIRDFVKSTDNFFYQDRIQIVSDLKLQIESILKYKKDEIGFLENEFITMDKIDKGLDEIAEKIKNEKDYPKSKKRTKKNN